MLSAAALVGLPIPSLLEALGAVPGVHLVAAYAQGYGTVTGQQGDRVRSTN